MTLPISHIRRQVYQGKPHRARERLIEHPVIRGRGYSKPTWMSLAMEDACPGGVRPELLPLHFYAGLNSAPHAQIRSTVSILTSGEGVGSPTTVYADGSSPTSPENGLSGGGMVIYSGEEELYATQFQLGRLTSSSGAKLRTVFRAVGEVIGSHEALEIRRSVEFRTDSVSF